MQEDDRSEVELLAIGRVVRDTFKQIETEARRQKSKTGRVRPPKIQDRHQTREFLIKIGRLVVKHEMDPVQFATTVRRMGSSGKFPFNFNSYSSSKVVERALKESQALTRAMDQNYQLRNKVTRAGGEVDDVETKKFPAEVELISRVSSLKTFLYLRNKTESLTEDNLKDMADFTMSLDPLACVLLSEGDKRVWELHYDKAIDEISKRPDILAAIRSLKLNWEGFLD